jgi:hypothetical protein
MKKIALLGLLAACSASRTVESPFYQPSETGQHEGPAHHEFGITNIIGCEGFQTGMSGSTYMRIAGGLASGPLETQRNESPKEVISNADGSTTTTQAVTTFTSGNNPGYLLEQSGVMPKVCEEADLNGDKYISLQEAQTLVRKLQKELSQ